MDESFKEQLAAAHAEVINDIKDKWQQISGGPSVIESLKAFAAAIDWTERWIIALLVVHVSLLLAAILSRRNIYVQNTIFFLSMAIVYNAERINSLAATHWESFSKQHYFDPQGVFTSAMLSAPLLLVMLAILINYLVTMSSLLIQMKKKELLYKARLEQKQQAASQEGASNNDNKKTK